MNDLINNLTNIENMIYEIRGVQVMLDSDLARIYQCANGTKDINKAVKRHKDRFPSDFYFQLNDEEYENLRFQIGTSSLDNEYGGRRYNPFVFTEQGVSMLATVIHTQVASEVSIKIMRSFVKMRRCFSNNITNSDVLINHENRLLVLESTLDKFKDTNINMIFFENQLYDSYSLLMHIFDKANNEIIIIDNYAGKELLDILSRINKTIIIVSKNIDETLKKKYESQYNNVTFINNNSFHDRFIIIDRKVIYTCGASFKDLGKKCFSINEFDDNEYLHKLLKVININ